jgi:ketosteroid isomerase-like protein
VGRGDRSNVERHGGASQRSESHNHRRQANWPSAAREIGTFSLKTKGPTPQEVTGKYVVVWEKVGKDWKLAADI